MTASPLTLDDPGYFDRLAEIEGAHWWSLGMWRLAAWWLDDALRGRSGLRAVDVGSGTGGTVDRLASRPEVAGAIGIEPSAEALALARRRFPDRPWVRGSALDLPLADATVDLAVAFDVFQHLPADGDRRASAELVRVLRPGGLAIVRSNARGLGPVANRGGTTYALEELVEAIASAGLVVRRATYANALPALAQEVRGRLPGQGPGRSRTDPVGGGLRIRLPSPWINRLLGGVSTAEAFAAGRLGARLPFGHSTMVLAERPD